MLSEAGNLPENFDVMEFVEQISKDLFEEEDFSYIDDLDEVMDNQEDEEW